MDIYEEEILTRSTKHERLNAYVELLARYDQWPAGSSNGLRVQAVILRDLVDMLVGIARPEDMED